MHICNTVILDLTKSGGTSLWSLPSEPPVSDAPAWETIATTRQSTKTPHWYVLCWPTLSKMQYVHTFVAKKKHAVNCSIKEIFIIHAIYDKIFVKKRDQWYL